MSNATRSPRFAESLERMLELYTRGECVAAWEIGRQHGPLTEWPGVDGQLLAGRLAMHLGASRLGTLLHMRAFRSSRGNADAQYYHVFRIRHRRGALVAWQERQRLGVPPEDGRDAVPDYHGQCAQLLGSLRDFEAAERHIERAAVANGRPYWYVERAELFEQEDRYADALRITQEGLRRDSSYPPVVGAAAHCLQVFGRDDEALELLRDAARRLESSHIAAQLVRLLLKRRLLDEVPDAIARYEQLTPLRERDVRQWLSSVQAELATHRADYAAAMAHIEGLDHPFYGRVAANLRAFLDDPAHPAPKRIELDVPFVRQHHLTCAPATLTAVSRFWRKPAEHLSVAEEICYDGTPDYSERRWATSNGWLTREFRVEWGIATALIDRGVPFTLTTTTVNSAHLQAVIGYDTPTGVMLARDPYYHELTEINARDLLAHQASTGPRGMAMVPVERGELLEGLHFPEGALYDLYHEMQLALERHDRQAADRWHQQMIEMDRAHRLTHLARRALAAYDDNAHDALAAIEALLELFPGEQRLQLDRLATMRQVASRDERLEWLDRITRRPDADASLWLEYAQEIAVDDRRAPEALRLVGRALRRRPDDAHAIWLLAELHWRLGRKEESADLYRFASCLSSARDDWALAYFGATRLLGTVETGLHFLRERAQRAGAQASGPTVALFRALEQLDRTDEAFDALEAAVVRRPDDGDLRLFAANRYAHYARPDAARAHLEAARNSAKLTAWLAESARASRARGDLEEALANLREVLRSAPLDMAAHGMTAMLLSETQTREAAIAHLRSACDAFPRHAGLRRLLYQWSSHEAAATREMVLRELLAIDPADSWVVRELALNLTQQARTAEALAMADEAIALDDGNHSSHGVKGHVLAAAGRAPEAAQCFRAALIRCADAAASISGLLDVCGPSLSDRLEALTFIEQRLETQPVFGEGLVAYRATARGVLTAAELLTSLRRIHAARPELWQASSVLAQHLADMGRTDEALAIIRSAAERFSKVSQLWYEVSLVHRTRLETDEEIRALERCRELDSESSEPIIALANAHERRGDPDAARQVLEAAIARAPLTPELRLQLAHVLHGQDRTDAAIDLVHEALRISPAFDSAWSALARLVDARGDDGKLVEFARSVAESRPREVQGWIRLAHIQLRADSVEDALASIDRAESVNPLDEAVHDARAVALTTMRRFREAVEACAPDALRDRVPFVLEGRAAWVDAQRGDLTGAIARMKAVVDRVPDYQWGWANLVEWYAAQNEPARAVEAARRWAWLDASSVVPLGWLGELTMQLGERAEAKEVFQRAMRLAPGYVFAGLKYFELQLADEEYEEAARTIEIMRPHAGSDRVLALEVELALVKSRQEDAVRLIEDACRDADLDRDGLSRAVDLVGATGAASALEASLDRLLEAGTFNPATPELWATLRVRRGRLAWPREYRRLAGFGPSGTAAIHVLINAIGERARKRAGSLLHPCGWYLDAHLALIRRICPETKVDDALWGIMGFALIARGRTAAAIRWLRDWRSRRGVQPWMLHNVALTLFARRRDREGLEVLRHAAALPPSFGDLGSTLRLWAGMGACIDGDTEVAERLLHEAPEDSIPRNERPVRNFLRAAVGILATPPGKRKLRALEHGHLDGIVTREHDAATIRLAALTRRRVGQHIGDYRMQLREWRTLHPWLWFFFVMACWTAVMRFLGVLGG